MLVAAPRVPQKLEDAQDTCHANCSAIYACKIQSLFRNLLVVSSSVFLFLPQFADDGAVVFKSLL